MCSTSCQGGRHGRQRLGVGAVQEELAGAAEGEERQGAQRQVRLLEVGLVRGRGRPVEAVLVIRRRGGWKDGRPAGGDELHQSGCCVQASLASIVRGTAVAAVRGGCPRRGCGAGGTPVGMCLFGLDV